MKILEGCEVGLNVVHFQILTFIECTVLNTTIGHECLASLASDPVHDLISIAFIFACTQGLFDVTALIANLVHGCSIVGRPFHVADHRVHVSDHCVVSLCPLVIWWGSQPAWALVINVSSCCPEAS